MGVSRLRRSLSWPFADRLALSCVEGVSSLQLNRGALKHWKCGLVLVWVTKSAGSSVIDGVFVRSLTVGTREKVLEFAILNSLVDYSLGAFSYSSRPGAGCGNREPKSLM